ncbi:hypothetical protein D9619_004641 [Psilocybe cf. subviscida]|uniref:Uncharacterized protein n=1 Tax=Psilocybe cf. subviscida TaxID=2480587 RepID=A0A8H5BSC9_9AGAR|nr:hypothetical protein D9619_004641 [Psilocybe cf. subviscida]
MNYASTAMASHISHWSKVAGEESIKERRDDIITTALPGNAVALGLINEEAQFAPNPGLQNVEVRESEGNQKQTKRLN